MVIDLTFHEEPPVQLQRVTMATVAVRHGDHHHSLLIQFGDGKPSVEHTLAAIKSYKVFND